MEHALCSSCVTPQIINLNQENYMNNTTAEQLGSVKILRRSKEQNSTFLRVTDKIYINCKKVVSVLLYQHKKYTE